MSQQQRGQRGQLPPPRSGNGDGRGETLEERQQRLFRQLRADLNHKEFRDRVAGMCPQEFRTVGYVDRLCESIFVACRDNPKLLTDCDRASLFRAAERIAKRGLTVGDNVAWLVPYKGQVQDQLGYKGAMIIVRRAVPDARFTTQPVYENDICDILLGDDPHVTHKINLRQSRGAFIGAYAIVKIGEWVDVEPIDAEEVEFVRSLSPGKDSPAWTNWYSEMGRKIPLKRLCKRLPSERTIDLSDMDDRAGEVIEGVADVQNWDVPQIQHSAEAPINAVSAGQQREREPARASAPQEDPQQGQAEHVDGDGVVHEAGQGAQTAPQEAPQQNGGRRRGGRGGAQNGDLAFPED
jgi:phage RecT family recombinase